MVIQERIITYNRMAGPLEEVLAFPDLGVEESNCQRAIQLGLVALGKRIPPRLALSREGYHELGDFVEDYTSENHEDFMKRMQDGDVLYTEPKRLIYPDNLIRREKMFHPVIFAGKSQGYVAQTLATVFSLSLERFPPEEGLIFHATSKVKKNVGNSICFWTMKQTQEEYVLRRLRRP